MNENKFYGVFRKKKLAELKFKLIIFLTEEIQEKSRLNEILNKKKNRSYERDLTSSLVWLAQMTLANTAK